LASFPATCVFSPNGPLKALVLLILFLFPLPFQNEKEEGIEKRRRKTNPAPSEAALFI